MERDKETEIRIARMMIALSEESLNNVMRDAALLKANINLDDEAVESLQVSQRIVIRSDGKHGVKKFTRVITF